MSETGSLSTPGGFMTRFVAAALAFALMIVFAATVSEAKEKQKSKPKGDQQEYLKVEMKDSFISGVSRQKTDKNRSQDKPGNTLSR